MRTRAEQRKFHYVYRITRFDGKYYIGLHSTDNLDDGYFGSGVYLWKSVKKHGRDKHKMEIVELLPTRQAAKDLERKLVPFEVVKLPECMNLQPGGGSGGDLTGTTRDRIAKAKLGKPMSATARANMSRSRKGVPKSPEHRAAISAAHVGKKGVPHTVEAKQKLARASMGRKHSEETLKKMSESQKGRLMPKIRCPFCEKEGSTSGMKRYHFSNCKSAC